jgi:hypothetical protein
LEAGSFAKLFCNIRRRNADFDGGFNDNKFFVFQNGRHAGENSRPRTAIKSQFLTQRRKDAEKNPKGIAIIQPKVARNELPWVSVQ